MCLTLSQTTNFRLSSKPKEFAVVNFEIGENGWKFSKPVENTVGNGETGHYEQFLLFPVFSKDFNCRHKKQGLFGKGLKPILRMNDCVARNCNSFKT